MTEKRFTIEVLDKNNWLIEDTKTGENANPIDGTVNVLKGLISTLNKFNDENRQLKSYVGEMEDYLARLEEENKKFKELYQDTKRQLSELGGKSVAEVLNLRLCLQKKYYKCDTIGKELIKDIARELDIELEDLK